MVCIYKIAFLASGVKQESYFSKKLAIIPVVKRISVFTIQNVKADSEITEINIASTGGTVLVTRSDFKYNSVKDLNASILAGGKPGPSIRYSCRYWSEIFKW